MGAGSIPTSFNGVDREERKQELRCPVELLSCHIYRAQGKV